MSLIVNSFTEPNCSSSINEQELFLEFLKTNAGCLGEGKVISLFNITTTADMVGLSNASSCTHNSPIWMHLNTSWGGYESFRDESIISNGLSAFHDCHIYVVHNNDKQKKNNQQ